MWQAIGARHVGNGSGERNAATVGPRECPPPPGGAGLNVVAVNCQPRKKEKK